ncbi:MAG: hypothetical protein ACOZBL_01225 [Patescibacteria group bacterium]
MVAVTTQFQATVPNGAGGNFVAGLYGQKHAANQSHIVSVGDKYNLILAG